MQTNSQRPWNFNDPYNFNGLHHILKTSANNLKTAPNCLPARDTYSGLSSVCVCVPPTLRNGQLLLLLLLLESLNHVSPRRAGLDVDTKSPIAQDMLGLAQYQVPSARLGWPGDGDYYLMKDTISQDMLGLAQYQAPSARLGWPGDGDYYLMKDTISQDIFGQYQASLGWPRGGGEWYHITDEYQKCLGLRNTTHFACDQKNTSKMEGAMMCALELVCHEFFITETRLDEYTSRYIMNMHNTK